MNTDIAKQQTSDTPEQHTEDSRSEQKTDTMPRVVIIGAGFGGLSAAKELADAPVHVTVIDKNNYHLFQPMLYQVATADLAPSDIVAPVREILRRQDNTEVLMAEVTDVDTEKQQVIMGDQSVPYDYLIIATGATSNYFGHSNWQKLAPGIKTLEDALTIRNTILEAFEEAEREPDEEKRKALLTFVLVGGGPTGVELAGAMAELVRQAFSRNFRHIRPSSSRIILVEGESRVMPMFPPALTKKAQQKLHEMGVEIRTGVHVEQIDENSAMIGKERVETKNIIWTAGVKASPAGKWLNAPTDHDGRVKVQSDLSVAGHPNIFVIGDTSSFTTPKGKHLPGLAPVAIQEGEYTANLIKKKVSGVNQHLPFHYFNKGTLATVGRSFAVVDIGPIKFTGTLAWFTWLFVHLLFLIGFRNRLVVLLQYLWVFFTYRRSARVILPEVTPSARVQSTAKA